VTLAIVENRGCGVANELSGVNEVQKSGTAICGTDSQVGDICCDTSRMLSMISTSYEFKSFASGLQFKIIKNIY